MAARTLDDAVPCASLTAGDVATIFRLEIFRFPQIEGIARILGRVEGIPGLYRVRFVGEQHERERFVFGGDWQTDPDRMLSELRAVWRATIDPAIIAEFFPDRGE